MSLSNTQQQEMNSSGVEYGLNQDDFMSLISRDLQEAEELRVAKEHEDEKAMYSVKIIYSLVKDILRTLLVKYQPVAH